MIKTQPADWRTVFLWLRERDLNPRPPGYENCAVEAESPWNPRTTALLYHQMPTICRPQTKKRPFLGVKWPKKPKLRPTGMVKGFLFTCSKRCTLQPYTRLLCEPLWLSSLLQRVSACNTHSRSCAYILFRYRFAVFRNTRESMV